MHHCAVFITLKFELYIRNHFVARSENTPFNYKDQAFSNVLGHNYRFYPQSIYSTWKEWKIF